MSEDVFLILWRPAGHPTMTFPFTNNDLEDSPLIEEIVAKLPPEAVANAIYRAIAADRAEALGRLKLDLKKAWAEVGYWRAHARELEEQLGLAVHEAMT